MGFLLCLRLILEGDFDQEALEEFLDEHLEGDVLEYRSEDRDEGEEQVLFFRPDRQHSPAAALDELALALGSGWHLDGDGYTRSGVWNRTEGELFSPAVRFANLEVIGQDTIPEVTEPDMEL